MSNILKQQLNPEQYSAVTTTNGPLLVFAGAGSGKTRVITYRIAYLLNTKKVAPNSIAAITFTNKSAREMQKRVAQLCGGRLPRGLIISTFHSLGVRILRRDITRLGYRPSFSIYDRDDQLTAMQIVLREMKIPDHILQPKNALYLIDDVKNALQENMFQSDADAGDLNYNLEAIYRAYQDRLFACNAVDFNDLILLPVHLLRGFDEVRQYYHAHLNFIMIDEYQDTNPAQYAMMRLLVNDNENICVVGDDDQSIYGWRGARVEQILSFEQDFPKARIIRLEQNYRSTEIILQAANAVIRNNSTRASKELFSEKKGGDRIKLCTVATERDEAREAASIITFLKTKGCTYNQTAILYRTNFQSRPFEEVFRLRRIPFHVVGSISFYERKEIKDILAYLRLLTNPKDELSLMRVINYPRRGIGTKTIRQLQDYAAAHAVGLWETLAHASTMLMKNAAAAVNHFYSMIQTAQPEFKPGSLAQALQNFIAVIGIEDELYREHDDPDKARIKMANVNELITGLMEFEREAAQEEARASLSDYLNYISLITRTTDEEEKKYKDNRVMMMTMHSAKGLEFTNVIIAGCEEGLLPHQRTIDENLSVDEERRLFYVGLTRARDRLFLLRAQKRFRFGEEMHMKKSRFLDEIPDTFTEKAARFTEQDTTPKAMEDYFERLKQVTAGVKPKIS